LTDNSAVDSRPSWSPDGQKIAYASRRDKNFDIFTMNADGSNETRLTKNPGSWDIAPAWSPDGQKIIFVSLIDKNQEIYVMNQDGSELTKLTDNPAGDRNPSWSPDGSRIAFDSNRDGNIEIYTMNADGSNQIRLSHEPSDDSRPSWSPDSQKIAFVSDRDFNTEIYVMDADGSNHINLTNNAPANDTFGLFPLPQSELDLDKISYKIVFESLRETDGKENWEICLIDADGSDFINLTDTSEIDERYPHASPDGQRICFEAVEGEDQKSKRRDVYIMNIDGTGRVKIAENAFQPCWSPDGNYLAYLPGEFTRYDHSRRANKGLEIYDLKTAEKRRHPNDEIKHLINLCWSPDGKWFIADSRDEFVVFKADDKTLTLLSTPGCSPDISPDGNFLIWNGRKWNLNIAALDFDSDLNLLTDHIVVVACERDHWVYHADWSPDGNYLTFKYELPYVDPAVNTRDICIGDLRTGKWTRITNDGKFNDEPDWVPSQVR
jgi:Tol biopolymer transport system component